LESRVQPHSQTDGRDQESLLTAQTVRHCLGLCALVLAGILPFAARAVYLDEPQFLHVANAAISQDWRFPQDTPWVFFGKNYPTLAAQTHLPVVEYYIAALLKVFGHFDEVRFRLLFAVFPLIAIVAFYRLARRFTGNPLMVSCLFAASPAFFVLSPTLMMDIPMLAFLLMGIGLFLDGRLWVSSICFLLAAGTGYTVLVPLGCLFIWAVAGKRPIREWIAIASAPAALLVWLAIMTVHFGESPATELVRYYTTHFSFTQVLLPMFSFVGAVVVFPWVFWTWMAKRARVLVAGVSVASALLLTTVASWSSISHWLWFVVLASSGIALLIVFAMAGTRRRSSAAPEGYRFLLLWLPATLIFFLLFAEMMSARYLLLALPPLLLVVGSGISPKAGVFAVVLTMILSAALAVADYRFVNSYPDWVERNIVPLQQQGFLVWNAAESGLRFYLEKTGVQTLESADVRPKAGDLIVTQTSFSYGLPKNLAPLVVGILQENVQDNYPVRMFSREAGAGFHDSHFGRVPFVISRAALDRLEIVEVSPFVKELPQVVPEDFSSVPLWFPGGVLLKQVVPEMRFRVRVPEGATVKYELEGKGTVELVPDGIVLKKESPGPIVWKNFRIVPGHATSPSWPGGVSAPVRKFQDP
jgi:4-amino-4-deoxy-L-arabinose transferase-like glycosyltransferase